MKLKKGFIVLMLAVLLVLDFTAGYIAGNSSTTAYAKESVE